MDNRHRRIFNYIFLLLLPCIWIFSTEYLNQLDFVGYQSLIIVFAFAVVLLVIYIIEHDKLIPLTNKTSEQQAYPSEEIEKLNNGCRNGNSNKKLKQILNIHYYVKIAMGGSMILMVISMIISLSEYGTPLSFNLFFSFTVLSLILSLIFSITKKIILRYN